MSLSRTASCIRPASNEALAEWQDSPATEDMDSGTQWPAPATGTDSELCSSATKEEDTLVSCDFDCGPPLPRKSMVNKGNAACVGFAHLVVCAMCAIIRSWGEQA